MAVGFALIPLTALDATWLWQGFLWISVALAIISGGQYLWWARHPAAADAPGEVAGAV